MILQIRLHRIKAHERRERDGICAIALKGFNRILLGCGADIAALGIQNDRHQRRDAAHMLHQALQLPLGAMRGKVGNLGFERNYGIRRRVHNGRAEVINLVGIALQSARKATGLRI